MTRLFPDRPFDLQQVNMSVEERIAHLTIQFEQSIWMPGAEEVSEGIFDELMKEVYRGTKDKSLQGGLRIMELYLLLVKGEILKDRLGIAAHLYSAAAKHWSVILPSNTDEWRTLQDFVFKYATNHPEILRDATTISPQFTPERARRFFSDVVPGGVSFMPRSDEHPKDAARIALGAAWASLDGNIRADMITALLPWIKADSQLADGFHFSHRHQAYLALTEAISQVAETEILASELASEIVRSYRDFYLGYDKPFLGIKVVKMLLDAIEISVELSDRLGNIDSLKTRVAEWHAKHPHLTVTVQPLFWTEGGAYVGRPEDRLHLDRK